MRFKDIILASRKVLSILLGLAASVCLIACNDDEPKDSSELITMWVSAETTTVHNGWLDTDIECMLVKFSSNSEWEPMPMGKIQGFAYEDGVEYELSVYRTSPVNRPGVGEMYAYRLDKIISQTAKRVVVNGLARYYTLPYSGGEIEVHFTSNMPCEIWKVLGYNYGNGVTLEKEGEGKYEIRFSAESNPGMGRVKEVSLRFPYKQSLTFGIWQSPRPFGTSEKFSFIDSGSLGYMLGPECDLGKLTEIKVSGPMNANDLYYLKWLINNAGNALPAEQRRISLDLYQCSFYSDTEAYYADCDICNIPKESLPYAVDKQVHRGVFNGNKYLTEVRLPGNIKVIGNGAFQNCPALKRINIPAECRTIGAYAFMSCTSLEEVEFPYISKYAALPSLEKIEESAFDNIGRLKSFVLPESLKKVSTTALSFFVDKLFILSETPPVWEIPGNAGYVVGPKPDGCTLYVPYGCSEAYKTSEKWGKFKIEEMPEDKWWEMIP